MSDPKPPVKPPKGFGGPPTGDANKQAWYWPAAIVAVVVMFLNSELAASLTRYWDAHAQAVERLDEIDARLDALESETR